jgi:uncharacterized membrane protein
MLFRLDNMYAIYYNKSRTYYMEGTIMGKRRFRLWGAAIMAAMAALIGWSIATGNAFVPVPTVLGGAVLLYLLRRQVSEVVADERNYRVSEKASRLAIQVFALVTAISGIALTAVSSSDSSPFRAVGLTLAFCACGLLVLYVVSYAYHSRRS